MLDHPEIYVAGDLASVTDPRTGHVLPPLAQVALEEAETVARNLDAELEGRPLDAFTFHDKGFVVSVGTRRGVADIAGITSGGRLAHLLKDAIEWEYRPVRHAPARVGPNSPVTVSLCIDTNRQCDLRLLKSLNWVARGSVPRVGDSHSQGCVILKRLRSPRPLAMMIAAASGLAIAAPTAAFASTGPSYHQQQQHQQHGDLKLNQVNLASDIPGMAPLTDPDLKNPWGLSLPPPLPCGSPIRALTAPPSTPSLQAQAP